MENVGYMMLGGIVGSLTILVCQYQKFRSILLAVLILAAFNFAIGFSIFNYTQNLYTTKMYQKAAKLELGKFTKEGFEWEN